MTRLTSVLARDCAYILLCFFNNKKSKKDMEQMGVVLWYILSIQIYRYPP